MVPRYEYAFRGHPPPLPQTAHLAANPGQGMGGVMGLDWRCSAGQTGARGNP